MNEYNFGLFITQSNCMALKDMKYSVQVMCTASIIFACCF